MSAPGWYPDPGGQPGRFRYWNGSGWSSQTSSRPGQPAPGRSDSRRRLGVLATVIVLVVVLAVAGILVIRSAIGERPVADPAPESTVSAWDDSQPTTTPTPTPSPSPSPSRTPSPSASPSGRSVPCPPGDPYASAGHPTDGRIYGGKLSFSRIESYEEPRPKGGLTWFFDVGSQSQTTEPGWESWFGVGEVATGPQFETPEQAANSSMQCAINRGWFSDFYDRKDIRDEQVTVDGHQGWILVAEVRVDKAGLSVEGDVATILIIDDGRDDRLSGYVSMVPIGDEPRGRVSAETYADLRVG